MRIHIDFETRSKADLEAVGATAYAMHPSTEVMCLGYAVDDQPRVVLTGTQVRAGGLWARDGKIEPGAVLVAQNAPFEDAIWEHVMHRKYGYPAMREPARWDCTMARALMIGLPGKLEDMARVLALPFQKDLDGRRSMLKLSKPKADGTFWTEEEAPEDFAKMYAYNGIDVEVERAADKVLPMMGPHERAIWEHTLVVNRRGVAVDLALARRAAGIAKDLTAGLNDRLRDLTGGFIDKATQIARMKAWLAAQGLPEFLPKGPLDEGLTDENGEEVEQASLDKASMLSLLERKDLSDLVRRVISIRQQVGKSSTAKYLKTIEAACEDGRVRDVLQYHAAHTGRDGGRLIQPQNYPKGFLDPADQTRAVDAIMSGDADWFAILYGDRAMDALSDALRGTIIAGAGRELVSADYNSIELCVEMWLVGDEATLAMLRRGEKPYVEMARDIYPQIADLKKETHPKQYDLGKRAVLGCGYGMGAPNFKLTCKIQANLDIEDELAQRVVSVYRDKYPLVVRLWAEIEQAAIAAVKNPGQAYASCGGKVLWSMSRDRRFLVARLPSGRYLWYWKPFVRMDKTPWGAMKEAVLYWGKHPKTKQWCVLKTYGGLFTENVTQAVARDLMMHGALKCEAAGFSQVLRVHDELLAEIYGDDERLVRDVALGEFLKTMCDIPTWATGCPVQAEGWVGARYRK